MLGESISAYKDDAGRCSEACPAHVALRAACIHRGKVAQWNHWNYFILPCCTTFLSLQKTTIFLPQHCCKSRTETSDITCATSHERPSQRASQDHMVGVTSHKSWIIMYPVSICFQTTSRGSCPFTRRKGLVTLQYPTLFWVASIPPTILYVL